MTASTSANREWRVRLDLELDQEQHDRVTRAIQSAVLAVVAGFDVASDYSIRLVGPSQRHHQFAGGEGADGEFDPFGVEPDPGVPDGAVMKIPDDPLALP
jgi:hypothetical protein